jgi:hypothetical protein
MNINQMKMKAIFNKVTDIIIQRVGLALICASIVTAGVASVLALGHIDQTCDALMHEFEQPSQLYLRSVARGSASPGPVARPETVSTGSSLPQNPFQGSAQL